MEYAQLWKRIVGGLIDMVAASLLMFGYAFVFGSRTATGFAVEGLAALPAFLLGFLYFVLLEAWTGKTLGKLLTGTRVVNADEGRIGLGRSLVRNLLRIVDMLPVLYIVGLIAIAASKNKQRVGDMAAKTFVING